MSINWKVRIKNKAFWLSIIPALLLLIQQVCALFGVTIEVDGLGEQLVSIAGTVFAVLTLLGVINDPTTAKLSDSAQAMTYEKPKEE